MKKLALATGSGWKGYAGGLGLIFFGLALGIQSSGVNFLPENMGVEATLDLAIQTVLLGLAAFGIRAKQDRS